MPITNADVAAVRPTFATLDGLRGVAALIILLSHFGQTNLSAWGLSTHAYLAVDLFFLMSGVVVAHAYEDRLKAGGRFGWFVGVRLLRLYPIHALGMMIGAAILASCCVGAGRPLGPLVPLLAAGLSFVPLPTSDAQPEAFPLNGPAWSLFYELLANFIYAASCRRLSDRLLVCVVALGALALVTLAAIGVPLKGAPGFFGPIVSLARVGFGFFGGVLLFRLHRSGRARIAVLHPLALVGLAGLLLLAPMPPSFDPGYELLAILVAVPLLVGSAVATTPRGELKTCLEAVGRPS